MKKLLLLALIAVAYTGCSDKNAAVIDGSVTGLPDNTKVYLNRYDGEMIKIDSTLLAGGKFTFQVKNVYPELLIVQFEGQRGNFPLIAEPGTIQANANFEERATVAFSGTESNELWAQLNNSKNDLFAKASELRQKYPAAADDAERDSIAQAVNRIYDETEQIDTRFIQENNNSVLAAYVLSQQSTYGFTPEKMDSMLNLLGPAIPANQFVDKMKERKEVLAKTAVGQPAPDFTLPQTDGTPFTLSSLKGNVVLIDFWASWCGPCRMENPHVLKMYNNYKDHGFTIVGVSLDSDREKWLEAIEKDGLSWTQVSEITGWNTQPAKDYGVVAIPHTVLIDREGTIVGNVVRGKALEELVAETLGVEMVEETE